MPRSVTRPRNVLRIARFLTVFVAAAAVVVSTIAPATLAIASASASISTSLATLAPDAAQTNIAKTSLAGFSPGNIISDAVFTNENTMTEAQIQSFLNSKVSKCVVGKDEDGKPFVCLKDLKIATQSKAADSYCSAYSGASKESSARIIYKVAQACNINPQVLIVMLQKEQGLVTHVWPSNWRYNKAMGQACPDTAPCDVAFAGFFAQVYGAARQMQIYMEGRYFKWYAAGNTWQIQYHPDRDRCGTSPVYIANKATEALYYYTPYQPNAAALRAGYSTGDSCSSYGNRNFYNYFTDWFGPTHAGNPCSMATTKTIAASWTYVANVNLTGRSAPNSSCATGSVTVAKGTIAKASEATADKTWIKVLTPAGSTWVPMASTQHATPEQATCALTVPAGIASWTYLVQPEDVVGRRGPSSSCAYDSRVIPGGTIAKAVQVSADDKWLKLDTPVGIRWLERTQLTATQAACLPPKNVGTASWVYAIGGAGALGRVAPASGCTDNSVPLPGSTVAKATAVSADDKWLKLDTTAGQLWVSRAEVYAASAAQQSCLVTTQSTAENVVYVVRDAGAVGRTAANPACQIGSTTIQGGVVATSEQKSADGTMHLLRTPGAMRWVHANDLRLASVEESICVYPSDTGRATATFVTKNPTIGRLAPTTDCKSEEYSIGANATVTAIRQSADGKWRLISTRGGNKWVSIDDLTWIRTN